MKIYENTRRMMSGLWGLGRILMVGGLAAGAGGKCFMRFSRSGTPIAIERVYRAP